MESLEGGERRAGWGFVGASIVAPKVIGFSVFAAMLRWPALLQELVVAVVLASVEGAAQGETTLATAERRGRGRGRAEAALHWRAL